MAHEINHLKHKSASNYDGKITTRRDNLKELPNCPVFYTSNNRLSPAEARLNEFDFSDTSYIDRLQQQIQISKSQNGIYNRAPFSFEQSIFGENQGQISRQSFMGNLGGNVMDAAYGIGNAGGMLRDGHPLDAAGQFIGSLGKGAVGIGLGTINSVAGGVFGAISGVTSGVGTFFKSIFG